MKYNQFAPCMLATVLHFCILEDYATADDRDDQTEALRLVSGLVGFIDGFYEGKMGPLPG